MKKNTKKSNARFYAVVFTLMAIMIAFVCVSNAESHRVHQVDEITISVKAYDSIWGLCSQYCPDNMDMRDYVDRIVEYNDMDSATLQIGQKLVVPIYEEG